MTKTKYFFNRFLYFSKSFGKIPIANPFILTVKAGRKLATPPDILIAKGKLQSQMRLYWLQFQILIYHNHVNTLDRPNY